MATVALSPFFALSLTYRISRMQGNMQTISRQVSPVFSAAFRASAARPRHSAVSYSRAVHTARQTFFGVASLCSRSASTRKTGESCAGAFGDRQEHSVNTRSPQITGHSLVVCTAGTALLPAMALFGSTATKDSIYEYTVKDAGESWQLLASGHHHLVVKEFTESER